jgi:hypothetical protein
LATHFSLVTILEPYVACYFLIDVFFFFVEGV